MFKREKPWTGRRYEYKTLTLNGANTRKLNEHGQRGWELIAVRSAMGGTFLTYAFMMREIPDGQEPSGEADE